MATIHDPQAQPGDPPPLAPRLKQSGRYRWTVDQLYWLDRMGVFGDRHVELIDGEIYEITIHPPHATATGLATDVLGRLFGDGHVAREQAPLDFGRRNLPEPDVAIVVGTRRDYVRTHPRTALLIVEVSDTTLRKDRKLKGHTYARAGIADYWIVNLKDRQLEIHRDPGPDAERKGRFRYADVTILKAGDHVAPLARPEARVAVADLLP
jgi:Uma2 family endonuclease